MDIDEVQDCHILDPDLLQLPGLSPFPLKTSSQIAEELFSQWLSLPETGLLVKSLIDDAKSGTSISSSRNYTSISVTGGSGLPSMFLGGGTPPLSPRSTSGSPRFSRAKTNPSSLHSPLKSVKELKREVIPQFYFQHGRPPAKELKEQWISMIDRFFSNYMDRLHMDEFKSFTKEVCRLPSFLSSSLFRKIDTDCTGTVTRDAFIKYWVDGNMFTMDTTTQIYNILRQLGCKYLRQADFRPVLDELLATHPGLEFLRNASAFQERYAIIS